MNRWLHDLIAALSILGSMLVSGAVVAVVLAYAAGAGSWSWYLWVVFAPLLYVGWLVVFLSISAFTCRQIGRRHPKPRHAVVRPGLTRRSEELLGMATAAMCYRRLAIQQSIPLVSLLSQFRHFDTLVLRAYSPSVHVGRNLINWGGLYDPDLTEIGDDVVLGGQSSVAAHSMVMRGDGAMIYVSAPVRIEDRATIGGEARIALGCVIGADAIVEAGAVVEPFTRIPPGEVWGGNPARFRRRREGVTVDLDTVTAEGGGHVTATSDLGEQVREIVLNALGLAPEEAPADLSTRTCPLWDSLGQVAVAAAVFDRFGITVDGPDVFRLTSVEDIVRFVAGQDDERSGGRHVPDTGATVLPDDVEMLPLLDAQAATKALAASSFATAGGGTPLRVNVAASFTAEPVAPPLRLWGRAFGFDVECRFAGYDQIVQALLDEGDADRDRDEVTVVLARPEDLPSEPSAATDALEEMLQAVEQAASDRSAARRLLVGTLPPVISSFSAIDREHAETLRQRWASRIAAMPGVESFDFAQVVERIGSEASRSSRSEVLTHGGYSQRLHQELAIALVRRIRAGRVAPAKVLALDCDNTLWGGIVGEVGRDGLELGPDGAGRSFQLFQQYVKRLKDRGLLLVVVSRNEEDDVTDVFAHHPEMILGADDIAAWRVNWQHKSDNLRDLADELGLGLDSFVFLDDDPAVRMEVKTRVPAVHVVPLPDDAATWCETLDRLWLFDGAAATEVDATRTQKAHDEQRRRRERESTTSLEEYLDRLELQVSLRRAGDADWPRVAQLTQRTNQFNLSLKRRTLEEVKLLAEQGVVLVLGARDRFGDYGQIGVCVLQPGPEPDRWEIDTLLMSCRALGRGVEDAFLHGIAATAADHGATSVVAPYVTGPRNGQVTAFLARSGFEEVEPGRWTLAIVPVPPLPKHVRFDDARPVAVLAPS